MKRLAFLFSLTLFLNAQSLHYIIKAPLFGKEGDIFLNCFNDGRSYEIRATLSTIGLAKKLSKNRKEKYHAKGFVRNNIYKATTFVQEYSYSVKKGYTQYLFDYQKKKITKTRKRWKNNHLETDSSSTLSYFTYNDFFSIYHNIIATLRNKAAGRYKVLVAGMEKYGGYLYIEIPPKNKAQQVAKELGANKDDFIFYLYTRKKILGSKSGKVIFAINRDGIADVVRVVDIPFVSHLDAILER